MVSLKLQEPELVERLAQIAAEQSTTAEELLSTAISEFLDKMARQKIHTESESFKTIHADLMAKYMGQYVAIHNGQVVDHDEEARTLYLRIREQYGHIPILIRPVTDKPERQLVFRSPRLTRIKP